MSVKGAAGTTVTLRTAVPAPPAKGDNTWEVLVTDAAGVARTGLQIDVVPIMPDHGHGTPVAATVEPGADPGSYVLDRINLMMAGYWETALVLADPAGDPVDDVVFRFCVQE